MTDSSKAIELVKIANEMRALSYVPYSGFSVGAALLSLDGVIYRGCNIENAGYTATNCAERTAFFKAVSEGKTSFKAIAVAGGKKDSKTCDIAAPCGVCRQVMREFCSDDFEILLVKNENEYERVTLGEILPKSFGPENLR